ncbi:TPA: hypothetical protein ACQGPQ_001097 [Pseudomonas aeruginosa]
MSIELNKESVDQADVAAKLTFINGRPAMCGCQVEYSDGGGEYSDVIYVTLCAKHSGSAILDLVATNRIALTPEYEGQWHADLYLDREIPLAKVEGATPAEAVLALMSAERIDPEQESVEQAGGDERAAFEQIHTVPRGIMWSEEESQYVRVHEKHCPLRTWNSFVALWAGWQARAALARVEQQERTIAGMNEAHAKLAGLYEAAQAQHSVPDVSGCRRNRSALTDAQMRRLYDSSTETENERLGFAAFARLMRRAEAVHQIAAAPGKEGV